MKFLTYDMKREVQFAFSSDTFGEVNAFDNALMYLEEESLSRV